MLADAIGPDDGAVVPPAGPRRGHLAGRRDAVGRARGHGRETTFQENQSDWSRVADAVRELAAQVTQDIAGEGRPAVRVGMKLRYAPFETRSRSLTLPAPTSDVERLTEAALELLTRFDQTRAVRLVGRARRDGAGSGPGVVVPARARTPPGSAGSDGRLGATRRGRARPVEVEPPAGRRG